MPKETTLNPTHLSVNNIWNSQGSSSTGNVIINFVPDPVEEQTPDLQEETVASTAHNVTQPPKEEEPAFPKVCTEIQPYRMDDKTVEGLCCNLC